MDVVRFFAPKIRRTPCLSAHFDTSRSTSAAASAPSTTPRPAVPPRAVPGWPSGLRLVWWVTMRPSRRLLGSKVFCRPPLPMIASFPGTLWRDSQHPKRMEQAKARLGYYRRRDTSAYYAALFLLTSSAELWQRTVNCFYRHGFEAATRTAGGFRSRTTPFSRRRGTSTAARSPRPRTCRTGILWTTRPCASLSTPP